MTTPSNNSGSTPMQVCAACGSETPWIIDGVCDKECLRALVAERNRYRASLETIVRIGQGHGPADVSGRAAMNEARDALRGAPTIAGGK